MNVILVMADSFRYDSLSCYGPTQVRTPRLDGFAAESFVFTNAYLGSFPTVPSRLELMSGRFTFIDQEWCPLPEDTVTLQQILSNSGVVTYLIGDNPHLFEMGFDYSRGFHGFEWIRGQETDLWKTSPKSIHLPSGEKIRSRDFIMQSYARNMAWWRGEEDRFVARSIQSACDWLEENQDHDQFFLHIELFDPHEPWDAPRKYVDMYANHDYQGPPLTYPHYDYWQNFLTQEELDHIRALYYAESTLVDHWFGVLLDRVEELGLTEDTAVIFVSDHGYLFGEHGLTGKSLMPEMEDGLFYYEAVRMYDEIRRVPLLIRLPGQTQGQKLDALVQSPVDLMPTVLDMAGLASTEIIGGRARSQVLQCGMFTTADWKFDPATIHGRSLMPLLRGETDRLRDMIVCSNTLIHHSPVLAKCAIVTQDGWCLHYAGKYDEIAKEGKMYTNILVDPQDARVPTRPALFYLPDDPDELNDVIGENESLAEELHTRYVKWLEEAGTPEEHLAGRRSLS
jgi:arylsulfatase A-like enzyme